MDETRAPVLDPGRGKTKTGWLWALARDDRPWGSADPPGVVYFYAPARGGDYAERFLDGFDGILQVDGYSGYNRLTGPGRTGGAPLRLAFCWSHARRRLRGLGSEALLEGARELIVGAGILIAIDSHSHKRYLKRIRAGEPRVDGKARISSQTRFKEEHRTCTNDFIGRSPRVWHCRSSW